MSSGWSCLMRKMEEGKGRLESVMLCIVIGSQATLT